METQLKLYFNSDPELSLGRVHYLADDGQEVITIRGKNSGAYSFAETFIWSSGVKNLCVFMLITKYHSDILGDRFILRGPKASLAAKLAFLVKKDLVWTTQMFGTGVNGQCNLRRLIRITNASFNLGPEVALSLNYNLINPDGIQVYLDNQKLTSFAFLRLIDVIKKEVSSIEVLFESFQEFAGYLQCHT